MPEALGFDAQDVALPARRGRPELIRDIIVFQVKLMLDGLRDFIMSPLSIGAGIIGVLAGGSQPDRAFRRLLSVGRQSDRWINLFDAYGDKAAGGTVDGVIDDLEEMLRRDYAEGGVTARTRASVEAGLERLREEMARRADRGDVRR